MRPYLRTLAGSMVNRPAGHFVSRFCLGMLCLLLIAGVARSRPAASPTNALDRVVAIGDVHGDFDSFCLILRRAHLVDEQNRWIGGNAAFVQTGDLIDRGPKGREVMDLVMALQAEAAKAGGQVVPLMGNHEVMNVLGDLRYVTPEDYAEFADSDSEKRRKAAYADYVQWTASHAKLLALVKQSPLPGSEQEWMEQHPAGFLEYRDAFSPNGKYGKWIRQHAAVVEVGDVIFLHGGIPPSLASMPLEKINSKVREEIENFDRTMKELVSRKIVLPFFTIREVMLAVQLELLEERSAQASLDTDFHNRLAGILDLNKWLCMRDDGPLWFRGYDSWSEDEGNQLIAKVLGAYRASHVVVAHTVQKGPHIRSRFDGKVFLIDTGMVYKDKGGKPSALDIEASKFTAIYLDGQDVLFDGKSPAPAAKGN